MTAAEEQAYIEGSRIAWQRILLEAIKNLGRDTAEWTEKRSLLEREEAISTLRSACRELANDELPVLFVEASHCFDELLVRHCSRARVRRVTWQTSPGERLEMR